MNENHPDFIGPRLPAWWLQRYGRVYRPLAGKATAPILDHDPSRPAGVTPQEWTLEKARRNQKPAAVRADDRQRWVPFQFVYDDGTIAPVGQHAGNGVAVGMVGFIIDNMLSGKLPRGAGTNTRAVSEAFIKLYSNEDIASVHVAFHSEDGLVGPIPVVPYKSGLHELRRARGRRI